MIKFSKFQVPVLFVSLSMLFFLPGCKKSDTKAVDNRQFFTATVNGAPFNPTLITAGTLNNSALQSISGLPTGAIPPGSSMLVMGASIVANDTTALVLIFPSNTQLNSQMSFNPFSPAGLLYIDSKNPSDIYYSNPLKNGTIEYNITNLNNTALTVSGTFSGNLVNSTGKNIAIAGGSFNTSFKENIQSLPGLKMLSLQNLQ